jgi:hypothetical protein
LGTLAGCGPIQSTAVLLDADVQVEAARAAGAAKAAPFEFAAAEAYLHKAREEVGYSDYEPAVAYARKALDLATQAKDKALGIPPPKPAPSKPSKPTSEAPPPEPVITPPVAGDVPPAPPTGGTEPMEAPKAPLKLTPDSEPPPPASAPPAPGDAPPPKEAR